MAHAQTLASDPETSCQRSFGRAEVALAATLESPRGRFNCTVIDVSLQGAQIETDQIVEPGESVWLKLQRLKIFATVQWRKPGSIGVCFEQKLPKAFVLRLLGEDVDPAAQREADAMLAARDWVMGSPSAQPRNLSLADLVGARSGGGANRHQGGAPSARSDGLGEMRNHKTARKKMATLFTYSAIFGSAMGLGSALLF